MANEKPANEKPTTEKTDKTVGAREAHNEMLRQMEEMGSPGLVSHEPVGGDKKK